jgi:hypothetical protein
MDGLCFRGWPEFGTWQQQAYRIACEFLHSTISHHITMFKRQPLTAVSSARPRCPVSVRVQSVRSRSDLNWANRQRGQEKGSNTMRTLNRLYPLFVTIADSYSNKSRSRTHSHTAQSTCHRSLTATARRPSLRGSPHAEPRQHRRHRLWR